MWLIFLEAFLAGALLIGAVWWTMFSGRQRGERGERAEAADAAQADDSAVPPRPDEPGPR